MPVCELIAHYNDKEPPSGPDRLPLLMATLLSKRIRAQGFIILDHYADAGHTAVDSREAVWAAFCHDTERVQSTQCRHWRSPIAIVQKR